ncbi:glycosyl transferase [Naviculisporaceae sp. PSN 640]
MEPNVLGLSAVGWNAMTGTVWERALAYLLIASFAVAVVYVVYLLGRLGYRRFKNRQGPSLPGPVARYLAHLRETQPKLLTKSSVKERRASEASSFGVYLGSLNSPPSVEQQDLLSQWDVVVVDPLQRGVIAGLDSCPPWSKHVIARLDMNVLVGPDAASYRSRDIVRNLGVLVNMITTRLAGVAPKPSAFTGILLANFPKYFKPAVINEFARLMESMGLDLWLELTHPEYVTETEARNIDMKLVQGLVYRNGMVRQDGDRQDYFQMSLLRSIMRAVAGQKVPHHLYQVMWETVNNDVELQYSSVARAYKLYTFYNTLSWIGHEDALYNASTAKSRTIPGKPLGALTWLKIEDNMDAHNRWRANNHVTKTAANNDELYDSLESFIPDLKTRLQLQPTTEVGRPSSMELERPGSGTHTGTTSSSRNSYKGGFTPVVDPLSTSAKSDSMTGLGCFQMGMESSFVAFDDLRQSQRRLVDLNLLGKVSAEEIALAREQIESLRNVPVRQLGTVTHGMINELIDMLVSAEEDWESSRIKVYTGLHSAFQTSVPNASSSTTSTQYWGLYDTDPETERLVLYLSNKTIDHRAGAILHTFLSSKQCNRLDCFLAEQAMAELSGKKDVRCSLPPRLVADITSLSPSEQILVLERLHASATHGPHIGSDFLEKLASLLEYQLIEIPSLTQQRVLSSEGYLSGQVTGEELVTSRLNWLAAKGCQIPSRYEAIALFSEIESRMYSVMTQIETDVYQQLGDVIQRITAISPFSAEPEKIDAAADIFLLAVFSSLRKLALSEVYLEVLDRNVYPNTSTDQPGCFAEHFALGSRCDSFFDTNARKIGKILSDRYRAYYHQYQPPLREPGFTELPTTYAAMQVDFDPSQDGKEKLPFYYHITFFGIFALPALVDVMLLTTIGRGLFLTTFMTNEQKTMATTALMISLLISGAFGAWITSGGSYYFFSSAFPAMNMFIMTRFVAGVAFTLLTAVIGFVTLFAVNRDIFGALTFVFYLVMLSTYMMVLSALSIYQSPGSRFLSGRTAFLFCVPILFISPIVTMFVPVDDIIVYVPVLTVFLLAILYCGRNTIGQWSSWHIGIPSITDNQVVDWYRTRHAKEFAAGKYDEMDSQQIYNLARIELHKKVEKESGSWFSFRYPSFLLTKEEKAEKSDELVDKLAKGYYPTMYLMRWYTMHKRSKMPLVYSTTWNLMLNAAQENMTKMQKGLKLHSAFLHWRTTGLDVWSGLLYFLVALVDKWVALLTGKNLVGLSDAGSETFRLGVGWGLCYYLLGALMLDIVSQPLWQKANEKSDKLISSLDSLREVTEADKSSRRKLYWNNLVKFFCFHLWSVAVFSALMWIFQDNPENTLTFVAYVGAYSGLLFYQYNKIYCGYEGAMPLAVGFLVGFPVGIILHLTTNKFAYSGAVSLGAATWVSAIISLFVTKVGWPDWITCLGRAGKGSKNKKASEDEKSLLLKGSMASYSVTTLEPHPDFSRATKERLFDATSRLSSEKRFALDPEQHPGSLVTDLLRNSCQNLSPVVRAAFPMAEQVTHLAVDTWQRRKTTIELVSSADVPPVSREAKIRTISRLQGDELRIFVVLIPSWVDEWLLNVNRHCRIIAEAIVQATAEHRLGLARDESLLAELLVGQQDEIGITADTILAPEGVKYQLEACKSERTRFMTGYDKTLLRYLLLGVESEIEWEGLPQPVRSYLLHRLCGSSTEAAPFLSSHEDIEEWFYERQGSRLSCGLDVWIARCELGASLTRAIQDYAHGLEVDDHFEDRSADDFDSVMLNDSAFTSDPKYEPPLLTEWARDNGDKKQKPSGSGLKSFVHTCKTWVKFLIISLTADPEYQRELDFVINNKPGFVRWPAVFFLNAIWNYARFLQLFIIPAVMMYGREHAVKLQKLTKGITTSLEKNRMVTESFAGVSTWFWLTLDNGNLRVAQYDGRHDTEPTDKKKLKSVNTYSTKPLVLIKRETFHKSGSLLSSYQYQYPSPESNNARLPLQRECIDGENKGEVVHYDTRGYQVSGSAMRGVNRVDWRFYYRKSPKFEDELLWAEYVFPHITIKVLWSMPPKDQHKSVKRLEEWIPFSTVTEATFIQTLDDGRQDTYHASWDYEHKFHPQVQVVLNDEPEPMITPPKMITEDWFHVLKKPQPENTSFLSENPFLPFSSVKTNALSRFFRFNVKRYPITTSVARANVWKSWKSTPDVDAVSARWLDDELVRSDKIMRPYWRYRDMGLLAKAKAYLDAEADAILARVDMDPNTSSWTHRAYKMADFYSFGEGGDSRINTRKLESQITDSEEELHVLAMDTSTWPIDPGGVSNCRRDMIDGLKSIRWHVVAETANDYGVPRYQIERNVQSLTILPLWGLDFLNPCHGVFETVLDSAVVNRTENTTEQDIIQNFLPILTSLVKCSQAIKVSRAHIEEATRALVDLNTYFSADSRNWNTVWSHPIVFQTWCHLWLSPSSPAEAENTFPVSSWWEFELPNLAMLKNALDLWTRYLFIFSLPIPDQVPDVFQASHHFTGAMYGIVCKVKRSCTLHIWDHCISFREFTTFMSSAVSFDTPFVNSTLINLTHLSCILLEHHADVVLPCCDYFNPGWEIELGTDSGAIEHRNTFKRKIDPVVNGISNMQNFQPIKTIKTTSPTVIMLSHVQYPKDLKNAILACDVIVNKWGFKDYKLHMYGEKERHASLATDLIELISSKNLGNHCFLMGLASPSVVLQDAWLFLNSSISEGLPLAMGEAALTGVPVVCTDVGASYCVVTDRATGKRFSEVVAPNDPESLARAQISVMALLGHWAQFAEDEPGAEVPVLAYPVPDPHQVELIQQRMYAKTEQRRALGLRGRANVLKNFSEERYLREHEQMLWIGKDKSRANRERRERMERAAMMLAREIATVPGSALATRHQLTPSPGSYFPRWNTTSAQDGYPFPVMAGGAGNHPRSGIATGTNTQGGGSSMISIGPPSVPVSIYGHPHTPVHGHHNSNSLNLPSPHYSQAHSQAGGYGSGLNTPNGRGSSAGSYYPPRPKRNTRLTPQSWISLAAADEKDLKKRWWSPSGSSTTLAIPPTAHTNPGVRVSEVQV